MGNWWLAALSQQRACSCIISPAEFFCETSSHPGDSVPLHPRFGALWLLAFPKTKVTFEREEIQTIDEIQENMMGQLMAIGKTMWGPKVPTLKGTEVSLSYVRCFLYFISSSVNASVFHSIWLDTFWSDLVCFMLFCEEGNEKIDISKFFFYYQYCINNYCHKY